MMDPASSAAAPMPANESSARREHDGADRLEQAAGTPPLSYNQEGLLTHEWLRRALGMTPPAMHAAIALHLTGPLDHDALDRAVRQVVQRHEALRTGFAFEPPRKGGSFAAPAAAPFRQLIRPAAEPQVYRYTVKGSSQVAVWREAEEIAAEEAICPFDYASPPLFRVVTIQLAARHHLLLLIAHHLVCDGWSSHVILKDIRSAYAAATQRVTAAEPTPQLQYRDFARWQRRHLSGDTLTRLVDYWKARWAVWEPALVRADELPCEGPSAPPSGTIRSAQEVLWFGLPESDTVRQFVRSNRLTLFAVSLSALAIVLHAHTRRTRIAVWTNFANRGHGDHASVVGWLANTNIIGVDVDPADSGTSLLNQVRRTVFDAIAHDGLPFGLLWKALMADRPGARMQTAVDSPYLGFDARSTRANISGDLRFTNAVLPVPAELPLNLAITDGGGDMRLTVRYSRDRYLPAEMRLLLLQFNAAVHALIASPNASIATLCAAATLPRAGESNRGPNRPVRRP